MDIARSRVGEFLPLQADGYACTTDQLLDVLVAVSCQKETIEQVCADLKIKVGAQTIRGYFNEQLKVENLFELQEAVNAVLQKSFSLEFKAEQLEIAIDYHDQSYYGRAEQSEGLWVGAEAKNGTTKVYRVATVYLIRNGHRLTLGIKFVKPLETAKEIVKYLLNRLQRVEIKARMLYLDRGFASIEVARYLKEIKQKAIIASPIRGKTGGLKALCVGKKSYRTKHIFKSAKHGAEEIEMAMFKGFTTTKKGKKERKANWLAYILISAEANLSAKKVKENYRKRFGIEASYRCAKKVRGWTTSANAAYRFVLMGMSFVLTNIWQELQEKWTRKQQVGRRTWNWEKFRLKRFVNFLRKAIENLLGFSELFSVERVLASRGFQINSEGIGRDTLLAKNFWSTNEFNLMFEVFDDITLRNDLLNVIENPSSVPHYPKVSELLILPNFQKDRNKFSKTFEWYVGELLVRRFQAFSSAFGVDVQNIVRNKDNGTAGDFDVLTILGDTNLLYIECKTGDCKQKSIKNTVERGLALHSLATVIFMGKGTEERKLKQQLNGLSHPII